MTKRKSGGTECNKRGRRQCKIISGKEVHDDCQAVVSRLMLRLIYLRRPGFSFLVCFFATGHGVAFGGCSLAIGRNVGLALPLLLLQRVKSSAGIAMTCSGRKRFSSFGGMGVSGVGGGGRGGEGVLPEGSPGCFTFLLLSRAKYANNRIGSVAACGEHAAWSYLHLPREGQRQGRQGGGGVQSPPSSCCPKASMRICG